MTSGGLLTLQSRKQGHETHGAERLAIDPRFTLGVTVQLLAPVGTDRRNQAAADASCSNKADGTACGAAVSRIPS
jgi:hypothetical protein